MSQSSSSDTFVRSILLPPPDIRKVELKQAPEELQMPQWMLVDVPEQQKEFGVLHQKQQKIEERKKLANQPEIMNLNTTLIGDYTATVFPEYNVKWLVQATGNATFASVVDAINDGSLVVERRYIFIMLGGNQLRSADKTKVFRSVMELVVAIRDKSKESRIFIISVLPRPVDNQEVKPLLVKFNRWLASAASWLENIFGKVKFLPVHTRFIDAEGPILDFFKEDQLTLNEAGAKLLKMTIFEMAGFVHDNQ